MSNRDPKSVINHFIDEVLNRHNLAALDGIAAEDFIERVPFPGQGPGRTGLRNVIAAFIAAFPDMQWLVDEQITEGEKVVTRFTMTGTHRGPFLGIPPTGKKVSVWGIVIDVVRNGTFVESRILMDTMGLMQQLGVAGS